MSQALPTERAAKRVALMSAVDSVRETLLADITETETGRTLAASSVSALRGAGLFSLKVPAELGGAGADPVTQIEVLEAVSYIDPSAGWSTLLGCGAMTMSAYLPQAAIDEMWSAGRIPTAAAVIMPGKGSRVAGGFEVSGTWSWASGVRHAEWIGVHILIDSGADAPPESRLAFFPARDIAIDDNWYMSGLKGTGSCNFSIDKKFVREDFTFDFHSMTPQRGGAMYTLGVPALLANELGAFAVAVGRRAIDEIATQAVAKKRGYVAKLSVADRPVFQRLLGESDFKLRAARGLLMERYEQAWQTVSRGETLTAAEQVDLRGVVAFTLHTACDIAQQLFRYGGGTAARLDNMLQRCVRDLEVASLHLFVTDAIYEERGKTLLGDENPNHMV